MGDSGSFMANPHLEICGFRHVLPFFVVTAIFWARGQRDAEDLRPLLLHGKCREAVGLPGMLGDTFSLGGFPDAFPLFLGRGGRFDFWDIVFCCTVSIDLHFSQLSDHPMYIYRSTDFMKIVCQVFTMSTTNQWTSMQRKRYLGPILGSRLRLSWLSWCT